MDSHPPPTSPLSDEVNERFDILEELEHDDSATLLRAKDRVLGREVILKLSGPGLAGVLRDRTTREQALREARALAAVNHEGIVGLFEVFETPRGLLLVMEPVTGESLEQRLRGDGPLTPEEVLDLGATVASALAEVHASGMVHRGLSAASIVISPEGHARVTGFQFVKLGQFTASSSCGSTLVYPGEGDPRTELDAAPACPAPELLFGGKADARSDVFSLGWTLFRALTGEEPYQTGPRSWSRPRSIRSLAPEVPRSLARVVERCLAVGPLQRYENAGALARELDRLRSALSTTGEIEPRRSLRPMYAGAGVALTLVVVAWIGFGSRGNDSLANDGRRGLGADEDEAFIVGDFAPSYASSRALLIGIGEAYGGSGIPVLANAESDVRDLAGRLALLQDGTWDVETLVGEQATRRRILEQIDRLATDCAADDRVFVYYAGHGETDRKDSEQAWMVSAGAVSYRDDRSRSDWVSFDELFSLFERTSAKHVLIAMDCCYGGKLASRRSAGLDYREDAGYLTRKAHIVISSGRGNELVVDGPRGGRSPFAEAFLDALDPNAPEEILTAHDLYSVVDRAFRGPEIPHQPLIARPSENAGDGDFVFHLR